MPESNTFLPPRRLICFNSDVTNDDGLLVNSIRRRADITFEEARDIMLRGIENICTSLKNEKEVALGKIGTLRLNDEGDICFAPSQSQIKAQAAVGLLPIDINRIQTPIQQCSQENITVGVEDDLSGKTENSDLRRFNPDNYYIPVNKQFAKIAASFIIVATVVLSIIYPLPMTDKEIVEASMVPGKEFVDTHFKNLPAVSIPVSEEESLIPEIEEEGHYQLIVASFHSAKEAEKFIEERETSEIPLKIVRTKKLWLISAKGADDKEVLTSYSKDSVFKENYKEYWIRENK